MGNILLGIAFIIGGLSGQCVLIGTESPGALAGVGVLLIFVGIFQVANKKDDPATPEEGNE
ncbi:MAG: hypothetical protein ACE5IR_03835 [bacterium]